MLKNILPRNRLTSLVRIPPVLYCNIYKVSLNRPKTTKVVRNSKTIQASPFEKNGKISCRGCGSIIHSDSPDFPGYVPKVSQKVAKSFSEIPTSKKIPKNLVGELFNNLEEGLKTQMLEASHPREANLQEDFKKIVKGRSLVANIEKKADKEMICQRCYNLQYHKNVSSDWKTNSRVDFSYLNFLKVQPNSIIVFVVDSFDLAGSLLKGFKESIIGDLSSRKMVVVFNKKDLLPKEMTSSAITRAFREQLLDVGLLDCILRTFHVSARSEEGVDELVDYLSDLSKGNSDIFLVGCTNVGKSELVNSIVRLGTKNDHTLRQSFNLTTSIVPGTTMGMIKIPLQGLSNFSSKLTPFDKKSFGIFDTPGIFNPRQLLHYLTLPELKLVLPTKSFVAKTYRWQPGRSLFLGGLARFDYSKGQKSLLVTIYSNLPIHMTNRISAGELMDKLNADQPCFLFPPVISEQERITSLKIPPLQLTANSPLRLSQPIIPGKTCCDISLAGLGWFSIILSTKETEEIEIQAYSRGGHGVYVRNPFMPIRSKLLIQPLVKSFFSPKLD